MSGLGNSIRAWRQLISGQLHAKPPAGVGGAQTCARDCRSGHRDGQPCFFPHLAAKPVLTGHHQGQAFCPVHRATTDNRARAKPIKAGSSIRAGKLGTRCLGLTLQGLSNPKPMTTVLNSIVVSTSPSETKHIKLVPKLRGIPEVKEENTLSLTSHLAIMPRHTLTEALSPVFQEKHADMQGTEDHGLVSHRAGLMGSRELRPSCQQVPFNKDPFLGNPCLPT